MTIIMGIDPGSQVTGVGIIEQTKQTLQHKDHHTIRVGSGPLASRLHTIYTRVRDIIQDYQPDAVAIEQVFFHRNARSALTLGQARAAPMIAAAEHQITVFEYPPRQIKQSVVGYGAADKQQMQWMIKQLLKLSKTPPTDAADALGIAICHANHIRYSYQGYTTLTTQEV